MTPPLVTVILPHYRASRFLSAAVESVLRQDMRDFRLVVVDDHSPRADFSTAIRPFMEDERLSVFRTSRNVGHYRIKNRVIAETDTPYVAMQDADDVSDPRRFASQIRLLRERRADIVGCGFDYIDEAGRVIRSRRMPRNANLWMRMGRRFAIHHPTTMMRREVVERLNGFDGTARIAADADFFLRAAHLYRLRNVSRALYRYRVRPGSLMTSDETRPGSHLRDHYVAEMWRRERRRRQCRSGERLAADLIAPSNDVAFELDPVFIR